MFHKETSCKLSRPQVEQKAVLVLEQMTLPEKTSMLSGNWDPFANLIRYGRPYNPVPTTTPGVKRLGVSPIKATDGPRGVLAGKSTCFPVSMARGASFDRSLERRIGDAIGKEARAQEANCFLGVCVNLLRHPAWGRAQETYGEDPFHVGEMGKSLMQAVQQHNVMACVKHYAVNNIENSRFFVSVKACDRVLQEVYLPHFKKIVQAGAASVMGAYNRFRGDQCCESRELLTDILRDAWGFEGFTMSDFIFGIHDGRKAIEAGMDLEMPIPLEYQEKLLEAVRSGGLAEEVVDRAVLRILRTLLVFENTPDPMAYGKDLVATEKHVALAREAAEKSMVLIKNHGPVLPFPKNLKRVLVLGKLAAQENTGDRGSSCVLPPYVVTPLEGLKNYLGHDTKIIHYDEDQIAKAKMVAREADCVVIVAGCDFNDEGEYFSPGSTDEFLLRIHSGYRNMGQPFKAFLAKTIGKLARRFARKSTSLPGGDRQSLSLKVEQRRLIEEVGPINANTVVCLVCGSMILPDTWAEKVPAILYSWYGGMEGGNALARVLFGDVNPSGKLPFTIPVSADQLPYFSSTDREITYDLYHGYTLADKKGHQPAFPFGLGLSYTTFQYSNLRLSANEIPTDGDLYVSVDVSNTGSCFGEEVVQLYVGFPNAKVDRPVKLLHGFDKISLSRGEKETVTFTLHARDLAYYEPSTASWRVEPVTHEVLVGGSSRTSDLLSAIFHVTA